MQLSDSQLAIITKQTEGWVACLQLAGLALQTAPFKDSTGADLAHLLEHHADIADYLMEEVLAQQPSAIQLFLMQTAVLDRFSAPLCDAVTDGNETSQETIAQLQRDNLFVIPLDVTGDWFRYHHLFSAFLRHQWQRRYPDKMRETNDRAALWFHEHGYHAEAVQQAIASGNFAQHALIFSAAATQYLYESNVAPAYAWFTHIPRQVVLEDVRLCVNQAWIYLLSGELETAGPYVEKAEALLADLETEVDDPAGLRTAKGNILLMRIHIAYGQNAYAFVIKNAPLAYTLLDPKAERLRAIAKNFLALTYLNLQQVDDAERELKIAIQLGKRSKNNRSLFAAAAGLGQIYIQKGELRRAKALHDEMLSLLADYPQQTKRYVADAIYSGLCRILYQWNALELVEELLRGSLSLQNSQAGYLQDFLTLAQLQAAQGNPVLAQQTLRNALARISEGSAQQLFIITWQGQLRYQAGQKDAESVQTAVSLSHQLQEQGQNNVLHQRVKLLQARHAIATGKRKDAQLFLDAVTEHAKSFSLNALWIEATLLRALATPKDAPETAVFHLTQALKRAQPEGVVRIFVDEGEPLLLLLRQLATQNSMADYVTHLLAQFPTSVKTDLTQRELTTLQLFAAGLSAQAIAENMGVSSATIYTYSKRIYRKLNVHSRHEAIEMAKELALL
jgi:LuxR family maltose regulon positive regulatory protein